MSVSAVSGVQPPFQPSPQDTAFRSAITQLTSAIGSGDLGTAQKAFAALGALQQTAGPPPGAPAGGPGGGPSGGQDPFSQLLTKIGGDLSSGDIAGAQSDLAAFQKAAAGHHHHHGGGAAPAPASPAAPAATSSSSNAVDITA